MSGATNDEELLNVCDVQTKQRLYFDRVDDRCSDHWHLGSDRATSLSRLHAARARNRGIDSDHWRQAGRYRSDCLGCRYCGDDLYKCLGSHRDQMDRVSVGNGGHLRYSCDNVSQCGQRGLCFDAKLHCANLNYRGCCELGVRIWWLEVRPADMPLIARVRSHKQS